MTFHMETMHKYTSHFNLRSIIDKSLGYILSEVSQGDIDWESDDAKFGLSPFS